MTEIETPPHQPKIPRNGKPRHPLASLIFFSRWLQAPLYLGLIVGQCYYVYRFFLELIEIFQAPNMTDNDAVILILGLIDVVMISNLLSKES